MATPAKILRVKQKVCQKGNYIQIHTLDSASNKLTPQQKTLRTLPIDPTLSPSLNLRWLTFNQLNCKSQIVTPFPFYYRNFLSNLLKNSQTFTVVRHTFSLKWMLISSNAPCFFVVVLNPFIFRISFQYILYSLIPFKHNTLIYC